MKIDYYFNNVFDYPKILQIQPDPVIGKLTKQGYHKCWAHQFSQLNRFYLRTFFDYDFIIVPSNNGHIVKHFTTLEDVANRCMTCEFDDMIGNGPVVQIKPGISFQAPETCFLEVQQSFHSPGKVVTGKFDCHKWFRPVHPALELEYHKRYTWPRGTILAELCFYTKKINEPIKLIEKYDLDKCRESHTNTLITRFLRKTKRIINNEME